MGDIKMMKLCEEWKSTTAEAAQEVPFTEWIGTSSRTASH